MKRITILMSALLLAALTISAKTVKVTIDGTLSSYISKLYLIIDEDTANAQFVPIKDGKFSVTVKVDRNSFIRLYENKKWPERAFFVLIPDSKHITVNQPAGTIEGSPLSSELKMTLDMINREGPGNFHIDVFSQDKEAWAQARAQERQIRSRMEESQKQLIRRMIEVNSNNNIPAWIALCFKNLFPGGIDEMAQGKSVKWRNHPVLKGKQ